MGKAQSVAKAEVFVRYGLYALTAIP